MTQPLALIVDDEPDIRELLEITLGRMEVATRPAANLAQAQRLLAAEHFDLCLTDMRLPDGDGIDLVRHIGERHPELPVAVITAHGSMEAAVEALKAGAFDFVSKPVDLGMLRKLVGTALRLRGAGAPPAKDAAEGQPRLLGESPAMDRIRGLVAKLARSQAPVYISGESGTGKEVAARLIHALGPRAERPFVAVNCGAIPQELMESEFFGHKKGSFTGATADKPGLFQEAEGGTLFLDEVADLPLAMQVKLLRAIQEKAVRPVGMQKEIPVDVRILSATHKDLGELVKSGEFRQDLYYRINVIELQIPPLRERREDIPLLAAHILERLAERDGEPRAELSDAARERLMRHPFPGNVRELENILERALTLCEERRIEADDLLLSEDAGLLPSDLPSPPGPGNGQSLEDYLADIERQTIVKALEETRWNKTAAAKRLGISFRALRYRLQKLGLD